ncbi:MAG: serine/threonine protein kinase [Planctomycetales bacterium]|nr:serine/threonine protein kinase [Planctomycetales bacterium]
MRLTACPSNDELLDFLLGKSDAEAGETIAQHASDCAACRAVLDGLDESTDDVVTALRQPVGASASDPHLLRMMDRSAAWISEANESQVGPSYPQTLRDYELLEQIGHGGMGTVYRAMHTRLKRIVAVKVIALHRLQNSAMIERFAREMETVGQLDHPNIVRAMDAGDAAGVHYLTMELLDGLDTQRLVECVGPLPIAAACELLLQAIDGLEYAHQRGVLHRDIKPSNLFVTTACQLRILDFGLARLSDGELTVDPAKPDVAGSLDYMAPEQLQGHCIDYRADIYALGVTLYFWLTYQWPGTPNANRSLLEVSKRRWSSPVISARQRRPEIPAALDELLLHMLADDAADRPQQLDDVRAVVAPLAQHNNIAALMHQAGLEVVSGAAVRQTPSRSNLEVTDSTTRRKWIWGTCCLIVAFLLVTSKLRERPTSEPKPSAAATQSEPEARMPTTVGAGNVAVLPTSYQVRVVQPDREWVLTNVPGQGISIWSKELQDAVTNAIRAWDLLELKINEPDAFAAYQEFWPDRFGIDALSSLRELTANDASTVSKRSLRTVTYIDGSRRVETVTDGAYVAAQILISKDSQATVTLNIFPNATEPVRSQTLPLDESEPLIKTYWLPWADEPSQME